MLYIAWFLSVVMSFYAGYKLRDLTKKIEVLQEVVKEKIDKPKEPEEPKSQVIDPLDPVQTAMYEHELLMKRLNPNE